MSSEEVLIAKTEFSIDAIKFSNNIILNMEKSIKHAYTSAGYFDEDRAHTALQMAKAELSILKTFINSLK